MQYLGFRAQRTPTDGTNGGLFPPVEDPPVEDPPVEVKIRLEKPQKRPRTRPSVVLPPAKITVGSLSNRHIT